MVTVSVHILHSSRFVNEKQYGCQNSPETGGLIDRNCSRASLHSDVVSLYYLQHSAISVYVIHFRHVTKELFSSVTLFCLANLRPERSETAPRRDRRLPDDLRWPCQ